MPVITQRRDFDGFGAKASRLGLTPYVVEAESTLTAFTLSIEETKHANGTQGLRREIDSAFANLSGWTRISSGGIDWTKSAPPLSIGVEVQVSGRSDLLSVDVLHLSEKLVGGDIDAGLIIVPDDVLSRYLTDRTPNFATAIKHVDRFARNLPIRVVAFRHDGTGPALPKIRTNLGRNSN